MICIAESGSTKTTWVFIDETTNVEVKRFRSQGLNPFFVDSFEVSQTCLNSIESEFLANTIRVHFYGAGCSSEERNAVIAKGLLEAFKFAETKVDHDLMAAARATCKSDSGVACILGTGSNSCLYDGVDIVDNIPALGYALGDEGSGSDIGRRLITAWLYREMSHELAQDFVEKFSLSKEGVFDAIYHQPQPNRYLAQFAAFCSNHRGEDLIEQILHNALCEFVERHVMKYELSGEEQIHFVGSIAHNFKDVLNEELKMNDLTLGQIIQSPIDELIKYHIGSEV